MQVQTGKFKVERIARAGVPLTPIPKEAIKVFVEFSAEEFTAIGMTSTWREVRADAAHFLKYALLDLVPADMIIEHAENVHWLHWEFHWECVNATIVLT